MKLSGKRMEQKKFWSQASQTQKDKYNMYLLICE